MYARYPVTYQPQPNSPSYNDANFSKPLQHLQPPIYNRSLMYNGGYNPQIQVAPSNVQRPLQPTQQYQQTQQQQHQVQRKI